MRRSLIISLLIVVVSQSFWGAAQSSPLSLADVMKERLPLTSELNMLRSLNPATMLYRDSVSISTVSVSGEWSHRDKAVMEQLGSGHMLGSVSAESYMRIGAKSAVWGAADFTTGSYHDIRWSDCIDYLRVAPYVLGDGTGGDLSDRRYHFSGGYATGISRWTIGAEASYRAEIAYRNRDPRIKTVVSDLDVVCGASCRITDSYMAGFNGGFNIYRQNCDLDFYNPVNDINTYTLTGLGTFYRRFMGNTNKNSGYESTGYNLGLQWQPAGRYGFYADAGYRYYRMEQRLRNYNNLTLGYSLNDIFKAGISYVATVTESIVLSPEISCAFVRRKGVENLFGTSTGASYEKIGSRSPYRNAVSGFDASVVAQIAHGDACFTIRPVVSCIKNKESYADPDRLMDVTHVVYGLSLGGSSILVGGWLIEGGFEGCYAVAASEESRFDGFDEDDLPGLCVRNNYDMLQADVVSARVSAAVLRQLRAGIVVSFHAGYGLSDYIGRDCGHEIFVAFGTTF